MCQKLDDLSYLMLNEVWIYVYIYIHTYGHVHWVDIIHRNTIQQAYCTTTKISKKYKSEETKPFYFKND